MTGLTAVSPTATQQSTLSSGILYLAFGESYAEETRQAIRFLRRCSAGVQIAVVTDAAWQVEPVPDVFVLRPSVSGFASKPRYIYEASPFERTLFLDTDTVAVRDVKPIFGLLNHYDVGVNFGGPKLDGEDGLEFHSQCTSGLILFRKNEKVEEMFRLWEAEYVARQRPGSDHRGAPDQRWLALAIAKSAARPVHLDSYVHFNLTQTTKTRTPPMIYHGRGLHVELIDAEICANWNDPVEDVRERNWLPHIAGILPGAGVGRRDPLLMLAFRLRRFFNKGRRALQRWTSRAVARGL